MNLRRRLPIIAAAVMLLLAVGCSNNNPAMSTPAVTDAYVVAEQSVVGIEVLSNGRVISTGSGVVVGLGKHVVTNHHVIEGGDSIRVSLQPRTGARLQATAAIVADHGDLDLALLSLSHSLGHPVVVSLNLPVLGAPLVLAGFPDIGGNTITVTKGTVAGFVNQNNESGDVFIKSDAVVGPGSSGGAALTADGSLLGIVGGTRNAASGGAVTYILSSRFVGSFVGEYLVPSEVEPNDRDYSLQLLGIRAAITVPAGWESRSLLSYFDAYSLGTSTSVVGVFLVPGSKHDYPQDVLKQIVQASGGLFKEIPNARVAPPDGFIGLTVVRTSERYEVSVRDSAATPLGDWISAKGLITVFAAASTPEGTLVAFVELPDERSLSEANGLLERIHLQR
jgi:S1-C subfamily serine protease